MKITTLLVLVLSAFLRLAGTAFAMPEGVSETEPLLSAAKPTLAAFTGLPTNMTYPELIGELGNSGKDVGSGVFIYVCDLADGSKVSIHSVDGKKIQEITHITGSKKTKIFPPN